MPVFLLNWLQYAVSVTEGDQFYGSGGVSYAARLDGLKSYVATTISGPMLTWLHAAFSHDAE